MGSNSGYVGELRHRVAVVHLGPFLAVTPASLRAGRILEAVLTYLAYAAGFSLLAGVPALAAVFAASAFTRSPAQRQVLSL
jgi:hypothetical protein